MVGRALTSIPSFTVAATEDYDNYIRDFQGKIGPQGFAIPPAFWTNEPFLKLKGLAKSWYNTTYTTQWHWTGSRWSPVRTLPVAPLWCDLGFVPNSRGNKAAANLRLTQNIRPEWEDLIADLQRLFGRRYTAADTWRQFCSATHQPHESGPAALQRIQELLSALTLLNVPATLGPTEQMC